MFSGKSVTYMYRSPSSVSNSSVEGGAFHGGNTHPCNLEPFNSMICSRVDNTRVETGCLDALVGATLVVICRLSNIALAVRDEEDNFLMRSARVRSVLHSVFSLSLSSLFVTSSRLRRHVSIAWRVASKGLSPFVDTSTPFSASCDNKCASSSRRCRRYIELGIKWRTHKLLFP